MPHRRSVSEKRLVVIDCGEEPLVLINPVILETSGEQTGQEGCLSVPNKVGIVTRPNYAKVKAYDEICRSTLSKEQNCLQDVCAMKSTTLTV